MTADRPGGQLGITWSPATETQASAAAFKAEAVADAGPGQDRDFLASAVPDAPVGASQAEYFPQGAGRPEARRDDTDDHPPSAVLGPVFTAENLGAPQVIQAMMNGSMPAYPRVGFRVASRALSLPGRTSSRYLVSTRIRARGRDRHHVPADSPAPLRTREDVGGPGRRDAADNPRRDGRLPAEEARSPQAVPEGSFLLHTQEELAPRNLLDDTARCLMPFLARGHHSPDEGGEDGGSAPGWLRGEFWIQILSSGPTADPARESLTAQGRWRRADRFS
jgi:hypothetical protein